MNHAWTSKQIESALMKLKNTSGWLDAHTHFRNFQRNATVKERRDLMRILVEIHGAYDNGKSHADSKYRISFDTEKKSLLLPEYPPDRPVFRYTFPNRKLMIDPIMHNLPPLEILTGELTDDFEKLIERRLRYSDTDIFENTKSDWRVICEIILELEADDKRWYLFKPKNARYAEKDKFDLIARVAIELFCMYEALESGWAEIQENCQTPLLSSHESYFLEMVKVYSSADLVSRCRLIPNSVGANANLKRLKRITANMPAFVSDVIDSEDLETLRKDVRSLSLDKSPMTPELLELILFARGFNIRELLLKSPNPETRIKAARWDDVCLSPFEITKRMLRRRVG